MLTVPSPIPGHCPYPLPHKRLKDSAALKRQFLKALHGDKGISILQALRAEGIEDPGAQGRWMGEAILQGPGPSPEAMAHWIKGEVSGMFQGTLAGLGERGDSDTAAQLLAWMGQLKGPFEGQIPQSALMAVLGLCAYGWGSPTPLPEGLWQGSVSALMDTMAWDGRRPEAIRALGVLGADQGGCGRWLQGTLREGLLRQVEGSRPPGTKAVAILGALLPGAEPLGPESLKGLGAQLSSPIFWRALVIQGQSIGRAPCAWLPNILGDGPEGLPQGLQDLWLLSRVSASPSTAPLAHLDSALEAGKRDLLLACAPHMGHTLGALTPKLTAILRETDHPMGALALTLLETLETSPMAVNNLWARLAQGDVSALGPALAKLDSGTLPRQMAFDLGAAAAAHPPLASALLTEITRSSGSSPRHLMALDTLAQALWHRRTRGRLGDQALGPLTAALRDMALEQVRAPGSQSLGWGRILGWAGEDDPEAADALLALIARTPRQGRVALLGPLGCLGGAIDDSLGLLLGPLDTSDPTAQAIGLEGLSNLALSMGSQGLGADHWHRIASRLSALEPEKSIALEPFLSRLLWTLSQA